MNRFLILGFEYLDAIYYCLIRYKTKTGFNEYVVTVMNGDLERLLYGNHIIREKDGCLQLEETDNRIQHRLKEGITRALGDLLGLPVKRTHVLG